MDDEEVLELLIDCVERRDIRRVKQILDDEAEDAPLLLNMPDPDDITPLLHAVDTGNLRMVQLLLTRKAEVNHRSNVDGTTALALATKDKDTDMGSLLVRHMMGDSAQQRKAWYEENPVFDAIKYDAPDFIHLLAASKAAISGPSSTRDGCGLLGLVCPVGHVSGLPDVISLPDILGPSACGIALECVLVVFRQQS